MSSTPPEKGAPNGTERRKRLAFRQRHDDIANALQNASDEKLKMLLDGVRPADLAEMIERFSEASQMRVVALLELRRAAQVLKRVRPSVAAAIITQVDRSRGADLLDWMPVDDRASILETLPKEHQEELLKEMESRTAEEVRNSLSWPAQSAGRLLQTHVVRVAAEMNVGEVLVRIREQYQMAEKVVDVYVVDPAGRLIGVVSLRELVMAPPERLIREIMAFDLVTANPTDDQEMVAKLIAKYDFMSIPIVNTNGIFLGIVTIDDIVDILSAEHTEDLLKLGGIEAGGIANEPYFRVSIPRAVRTRVGWLALLFLTETFTGTVLRNFEDELKQFVALSFFIPLLIGTGGNAGSQTVSTIIRGLALGEIRQRDTWRVMAREAGTGLLLGLILGTVTFFRALLWNTGSKISFAVGFSVLAITTWANSVGALIPILAERAGIDPTVVSAPAIATLVDATGLFIYFKIADIILHL